MSMKMISNRLLSVLSLTLLVTFFLPAGKASAQYDNQYVSYNDFYQDLAPYGQWIEDGQYGYVWSPDVDESFRPYYTNGYWAMTDYGNTWVSSYSWGWACFHYGRWTYDNYYGWLWIPGQDWGPAWVSWRYGGGYYGWAPLGPGYEFGDNYSPYSCPNDWWVFIPPQYLYTGGYYHYWYGPRGNSEIIHNTELQNNTYRNNNITYVGGPRAHDVEQITHKPVQVFKINNSTNLNTRVHDNVIKMYRPAQIRPAASIAGQRVAPPNVVSAPQQVHAPQPMNSGRATPPQFHNDVPRNTGRTETPGTNVNQVAQPARPQPRDNNNPYEWDGSKQPQPQQQEPREATPPQNTARPEPQPERQQPEPQRAQPQPSMPRPMPQPQNQPRPAPAPAPARSNPAPAPGRR